MRWMSFCALILTTLAVATIFAPSPGHAAEQKWCAQYGRDGGRNCGFATIEQCRLTVSGIGGFCEINQFYTGPDKQPAPRRKKRSR